MPVKTLNSKLPTSSRSAGLRGASKSQKLDKKSVKKVSKTSVKKIKMEVSVPISKPAKKTGLTLDVFDVSGKAVGTLTLPQEIFGAKINKDLLSQAVRVYLANQRIGTASTKDRGEVHGTTKKVWQQKGTGRARHGSKKAPIFVHGGVAFGPRPHDFSLKLSKKMRIQALFSALSSKVKDKEIKIVTGLEKITPKTKIMVKALSDLGIQDKKKILLVTPTGANDFDNVYRSARNIEGVRIMNANMLNAYKVLDNKLIVLMKDAVDSIKGNFLREGQ